MKRMFRCSLIVCCLLLLCLSLPSCQKQKADSIFDLVDYMIGVSLDPGYFTINGRYLDWSPSRDNIEWVFGQGREVDSKTLIYEKIGLIVHLHEKKVETLELLYDSKAGSQPVEKPFQGMVFINGVKIPSTTKADQIKELFPEFDIAHQGGIVKLASKTDHILFIAKEMPETGRKEIMDYYRKNMKLLRIKEFYLSTNPELNNDESVKEGFYAVPKGFHPAIENYMVNTLKVDDYVIMSKHPITLALHFNSTTGKLQNIKVRVGVHKRRTMEFY